MIQLLRSNDTLRQKEAQLLRTSTVFQRQSVELVRSSNNSDYQRKLEELLLTSGDLQLQTVKLMRFTNDRKPRNSDLKPKIEIREKTMASRENGVRGTTNGDQIQEIRSSTSATTSPRPALIPPYDPYGDFIDFLGYFVAVVASSVAVVASLFLVAVLLDGMINVVSTMTPAVATLWNSTLVDVDTTITIRMTVGNVIWYVLRTIAGLMTMEFAFALVNRLPAATIVVGTKFGEIKTFVTTTKFANYMNSVKNFSVAFLTTAKGGIIKVKHVAVTHHVAIGTLVVVATALVASYVHDGLTST